MTPDQVCKLGDEACQLLNSVLKRCHDWQCVLDALSKIPLDVSQQQLEMTSQQHLAEGLKAILFPNNP